MKSAEEWASKLAMGLAYESIVKQIQHDALLHAAQCVHDMSRGTKSEDRAIALDNARDLILDIASNLQANDG